MIPEATGLFGQVSTARPPGTAQPEAFGRRTRAKVHGVTRGFIGLAAGYTLIAVLTACVLGLPWLASTMKELHGG